MHVLIFNQYSANILCFHVQIKTPNFMTFKQEATNFYIFIWPIPAMLAMPWEWDNKFLYCYVNFQPSNVLEKASTHCIMAFSSHNKFHHIDSYCSDCLISQCYICSRSTKILHNKHLCRPMWICRYADPSVCACHLLLEGTLRDIVQASNATDTPSVNPFVSYVLSMEAEVYCPS